MAPIAWRQTGRGNLRHRVFGKRCDRQCRIDAWIRRHGGTIAGRDHFD